MPNTITITGVVTDSLGATFSYSAVATQDTITAVATITPPVAPAGTTRTLVVTPSGGVGPYSFGPPVASGITFVPITGQPGQWTFVY